MDFDVRIFKLLACDSSSRACETTGWHRSLVKKEGWRGKIKNILSSLNAFPVNTGSDWTNKEWVCSPQAILWKMLDLESLSKYQIFTPNCIKYTPTSYSFIKGPEGHDYETPQKGVTISITASVIDPCDWKRFIYEVDERKWILPIAIRKDKKMITVCVLLILLLTNLAISSALCGPPWHLTEVSAIRNTVCIHDLLFWLWPFSTILSKVKKKKFKILIEFT